MTNAAISNLMSIPLHAFSASQTRTFFLRLKHKEIMDSILGKLVADTSGIAMILYSLPLLIDSKYLMMSLVLLAGVN